MINSIEVENVIKKVVKNLTMQRTLTEMQSLFMNQMQEILPQEPSKTVQEDAHIERVKDIFHLNTVDRLLNKELNPAFIRRRNHILCGNLGQHNEYKFRIKL